MALYEKDNYLNKDIEYLINREIIEYDIRSGGFNVIKRYKLIDQSKIEYLESLDKQSRKVMIGLYQRDNPELKESLNSHFAKIRGEFFEANNITEDDVLSIKKDAIITLRRCQNTTFDNILFVEKNIYSSYFYINKMEFYVKPDGLDVKGISDDKLKLHRAYMLDYMYRIFKLLETNPNRKYIVNALREFISYYKDKRLHLGYYRELNRDSLYKLENDFLFDHVGLHNITSLDGIDISYNYMRYIVPMVNILL